MKFKNVIVPNPKRLESLKRDIAKAGPKSLFVLADFDGTLIKAFFRGKKVPSLISILRSEKLLGEKYSEEAFALYNKYSVYENNPKLSLQKKEKLMDEWWRTHFKLLIESGLNKKHIKKVVNSKKLNLREGVSKLFDILRRNNIPLIILSSSGLGIEAISMYFKKKTYFIRTLKLSPILLFGARTVI